MSVPQLAIAAIDKDVYHIVSYSDTLPKKYKKLLLEAAGEHPFLVLDECKDNDPPLTPQELAKRMVASGDSTIFAEYRLDDDDVLPADYYEQIEPYLNSPFVGMYVSLGEGLTAVYLDGDFYDVRRCRSPMLAIGLAKVCRIKENGDVEAPRTTRHTVSDTVAPVILDSRKLGFLWSRHPEQDTAVSLSFSHTRKELFERARRQIERYPIEEDAAKVAEHFPTISSRIHTDIGPGMRQFPLVSARTRITSGGLDIETPRLRGKCSFEVITRASTTKPGRDVLLSFHLQNENGRNISPAEYEDELKERGIIYSSWHKVGFCRWVATRPGLRKDEFVIDLPNGVVISGLTLFSRPGIDARLDVEKLIIVEG